MSAASVFGSATASPASNGAVMNVEPWLAWAAVFLLYVGEVRIPIGSSELYFPMALLPVMLLVGLRMARGQLFLPWGALMLCTVIGCGVLGWALNDSLALQRSLAAMFPVVAAILSLAGLAGVSGIDRIVESATIWGGAVLSAWVLILAFEAFTSSQPYYEAKLLIETPLGRSNYLSAFLLFVCASAWHRSRLISLMALAAIVGTLSRGGLAAFVIFLFLVAMARIRLAVASMFALLAVSIVITVYVGISDFELLYEVGKGDLYSGITSTASFGNRGLLWRGAFELLADSGWIGVGPNGFRNWVEITPGVEDVWGPHSAPLLLWLNYGAVGTAAYLLYLAMLWRARALIAPQNHSGFTDLRGCALLSLFVLSMTEPLVGSASFEVFLAMNYAAALQSAACRQLSPMNDTKIA